MAWSSWRRSCSEGDQHSGHPSGSLFSFEAAPMHMLRGHEGCVNCLEWGWDGEFLFSGSDDQRIGVHRVTDTLNPSLQHSTREKGSVSSYFHPTAHRANIFDIALFPFRRDGTCISVAMDGTVVCNDLQAEMSYLLYDVLHDPHAATRFGIDSRVVPPPYPIARQRRMALQCSFLPQLPFTFLATVGEELNLFDLREQRRGSCQALGPGRVFRFVPPEVAPLTVIVSAADQWRLLDLRNAGNCNLSGRSAELLRRTAEECSGIDVSADGALVAVSHMNGPVRVFPLSQITRGSTDLPAASWELRAHSNAQTFLKQPAFFRVSRRWCVGHGCDTGSAVCYELPTRCSGEQTCLVRSSLENGATEEEEDWLNKLPPSLKAAASPLDSDIEYDEPRWTLRQVDSTVCNVVCPHPTMAAGSNVGVVPWLAASGISSSVALVHLRDDNHPRTFLHHWSVLDPAVRRTTEHQARDTTEPQLLRLKELAISMLQARRFLVALELFQSLFQVCVVMAGSSREAQPSNSNQDSARGTAWLKPHIVACASNAALAALRLQRFRDVKRFCDEVLAREPNNAKALFRRGTACRALGELDEALENAASAVAACNGSDASIAALHASLKDEVRKKQETLRQRFSKMFGCGT